MLSYDLSHKNKIIMEVNNITATAEAQNPQKVTVSDETLSYITCLRKADELWDCMYKAFEKNYDCQTAENIMDKELRDKINAMREVINRYLCECIDSNISGIDELTEI